MKMQKLQTILQKFKNKRKTTELQLERAQTELAFLKSRLNSGFLYDTLNYMHSMAYPVSDHLAEIISKLADLTQYISADNFIKKVSLQQEVLQLHNYIELYQMPFSDNFYVDVKINDPIDNIQIPPLLLTSFVENAFKSGVTNDAKRPVKIYLQAYPHRLTFTLSYKVNHIRDEAMTNIRGRLALFYPEKHELLIASNGETHKSTLIINLD
jgi:two-component system LytT family sensor kinase